MQALRVVMLLVTVAVCYLLFFHSQSKLEVIPTDPLPSAEVAANGQPAGSPPTVHSQYKEAMDRAHAAAKSMQDERKEADSY